MAHDQRPGLDPRRLVGLMRAAIERVGLGLGGRVVFTEAATGAYAVTPVLAALAGARVYALAGDTPYAPSSEIEKVTLELARIADVTDRIELVREKSPAVLSEVDIVTNSGQVRPIDAAMVANLKSTCAVPLMYEAWEYRAADVDLDACRARGIPVAGTNERHASVDVFSFLGPLAVRELHDAGIAVYGSHVVLLCDNDFAPFIREGLQRCGALVSNSARLTRHVLTPPCDAVLVALKPRHGPVVTEADANLLAECASGTALVQYWGDVDRQALAHSEVPVWPPHEPVAGHMAVLLSAIGPEPIVRLQAGGLKVGEVLTRGLDVASAQDRELVQPL